MKEYFTIADVSLWLTAKTGIVYDPQQIGGAIWRAVQQGGCHATLAEVRADLEEAK